MTGTVELTEKDGELHISGTLEGLRGKEGKHGFHVHEDGEIGDSLLQRAIFLVPMTVSQHLCTS